MNIYEMLLLTMQNAWTEKQFSTVSIAMISQKFVKHRLACSNDLVAPRIIEMVDELHYFNEQRPAFAASPNPISPISIGKIRSSCSVKSNEEANVVSSRTYCAAHARRVMRDEASKDRSINVLHTTQTLVSHGCRSQACTM